MSSLHSSPDGNGKANQYTPSPGSKIVEPRHHPNFGNSSAQGFDLQNPKEVVTCWIAAEKALEHIRRQFPSISKAFEKRNIPKTAYSIQAGFDESLITSGAVYLEQIHIFLAGDVKASSRLLSKLGKLCLPFSGILIRDSGRLQLPGFKDEPSLYDNANQLTIVEREPPIKTPFTSISCTMIPDMHSSTQSNFQELDRNHGAAEENTREFPGTARVSFQMASSIYPAAQDDGHHLHEKITVDGGMIIETTATSRNPFTWARRHVRFDHLKFSSTEPKSGYKPFFVGVVIDSCQNAVYFEDFRPKTIYPEETESSLTSSWTCGIKTLFSMISSTARKLKQSTDEPDNEPKKISITSYTSYYGKTQWNFPIEDVKLQEEGLDMEEMGILPNVKIRYLGQRDNIPKPPPHNIQTTIMSCWSRVPNESKNGVRNLLNDLQKQPTNYSNLVNVVLLDTTLDSSSISNPSFYKTNSMVRSDMAERNANEHFKGITGSDDAERIKLNISTLGEVELSRQCDILHMDTQR